MAAWLMATSGVAEPGQIHIAIEVPHGPVVETLIERGFKVSRHQPEADGSLPRPLHAGGRQG